MRADQAQFGHFGCVLGSKSGLLPTRLKSLSDANARQIPERFGPAQHRLYLRPLPHGHKSLRPGEPPFDLGVARAGMSVIGGIVTTLPIGGKAGA